uniref:Uncharacterized protein n=1 Tax=Arundo donax TaxID=35708 RepID=A0A0A8ZK78_ARUDO
MLSMTPCSVSEEQTDRDAWREARALGNGCHS